MNKKIPQDNKTVAEIKMRGIITSKASHDYLLCAPNCRVARMRGNGNPIK